MMVIELEEFGFTDKEWYRYKREVEQRLDVEYRLEYNDELWDVCLYSGEVWIGHPEVFDSKIRQIFSDDIANKMIETVEDKFSNSGDIEIIMPEACREDYDEHKKLIEDTFEKHDYENWEWDGEYTLHLRFENMIQAVEMFRDIINSTKWNTWVWQSGLDKMDEKGLF